MNLGSAPYTSASQIHEILHNAGIFVIEEPQPPLPPPPPPPPKMPKCPIPHTILGEDYVNVCDECGSTLIWDIRFINHNAPLRATFVNWFRRVILRRPPIGCLGSYSYGENCENYAGDKDEQLG